MLYFKTVIWRGINTNSFFVPVEASVLKKQIRLKNLSFGMRCKIFMSNHHINLHTKIHVIGKFKLHPTEKKQNYGNNEVQ